MNNNSDELEDEEVVIEGSELHKFLLQMGLNNFETVSSENIIPKPNNSLIQTNSKKSIQFEPWGLCHKIFQDKQLFKQKLQTILLLKPLLDDHAYNIQNLNTEEKYSFWNKIYKWLPSFGTGVATFASIMLKKNKLLTISLASFTTLCLYNEYLKYSSVYNLGTLVSSQNSLYNNVTKCLKILYNDFRIRKNCQKHRNKLLEFKRNQHKFLIPLLSSLIKTLQHISCINYEISKNIYKCLSVSKNVDQLFTTFDDKSFTLEGEVTYDSLKNLYYIYLLTQSEMLHLLASAYNEKLCNVKMKLPEHKFNYMINRLIETITFYNGRLLKIVNEYNACDIKIIHRKFRGNNSKWQDIYLQLDVSSQKLQTSYLLISSIINTIDYETESDFTDDELIKVLSNKMNEAHKQIEAARSFLDLGILLTLRRQRILEKSDDLKVTSINISDMSKPLNSAPVEDNSEVIDEVFEEYIKEEYLKPLFEYNTDDYNDVSYKEKINKFLSMNYMEELKEVLIEKYKVMSERENKALARMHNKIVTNEDNKTDGNIRLPDPPPRPTFNLKSTSKLEKIEENEKEIQLPFTIPKKNVEIKNENNNDSLKLISIENKISMPKKSVIDVSNIPPEEKENLMMKFAMGAFLPKKPTVSFLTNEEETFIGCGENSEDELTSSEDDNDDS